MGAFQGPQRCRKAPSTLITAFSNDEVFTTNLNSITTNRRQLEGMIDKLGGLREFEAGETCMMKLTEGCFVLLLKNAGAKQTLSTQRLWRVLCLV